MAAKAKVKPKGRIKKIAKQPTKARGRPKGLQLTTAQHNAYNKAYQAKATLMRRKLAVAAAHRRVNGMARGLQKRRLSAAYGMTKAYNNAYHNAQAAAVAANATRMSLVQSKLAHQNTALLLRIEHNAGRHAQLLSQAQYVQAGEKAFAHNAVMRTVTTAQARSHYAKFLAKLLRNATAASKSTKNRKKGRKFKSGPNSAAIAKAAAAAGRAAAKQANPKGAKMGSGRRRGRPLGSGKGGGPAKAVKMNVLKHVAKQASQSKKAPAAPAKKRTAPMYALAQAAKAKAKAQALAAASPDWVGDEFTPNCVITALANNLLHVKSIRADEASIRELTEACPEEPTIEQVLWQAWLMHWPRNDRVHIKTYRPSLWRGDPDMGGLIVGYETEHGDHAALALANGCVVSWGAMIERAREVPIEEAWEVLWES